jgi:hypothetical protein
MKLLFFGEPEALAPGVVLSRALRALTLPARFTLAAHLVVIVLTSQAVAGPVTNFDDIKFWVGSGANQAALAIDWNGPSGSDNSLVWGYRWNGTAKGIDMLTAIVTADDRLYAKLGPISGFGFAVVGIGYDANNDELFALDDDTSFDEYGISNAVPADGALSLDPEDWYAEGWFLSQFWNYGVAASSPFDDGAWARSGSGISSRNLSNGSWDSLAVTPINTQSYAQNPLAAEPTSDADFNADGFVDGRDFLIWQRGESPHPLSAADLALWTEQYGTNTNTNAALEQTQGMQSLGLLGYAIPEPATGVLLIALILLPLRLPSFERKMFS